MLNTTGYFWIGHMSHMIRKTAKFSNRQDIFELGSEIFNCFIITLALVCCISVEFLLEATHDP
jgi:hypothetical protein